MCVGSCYRASSPCRRREVLAAILIGSHGDDCCSRLEPDVATLMLHASQLSQVFNSNCESIDLCELATERASQMINGLHDAVEVFDQLRP